MQYVFKTSKCKQSKHVLNKLFFYVSATFLQVGNSMVATSSSNYGCLRNTIYLLPLKSGEGLAAPRRFRKSISKLSQTNSDVILI